MLSAFFNTVVVRASDAPGGIDMEKVTKLSSSVGIKLDGVLFMSMKPIEDKITNARGDNHFLPSRKFRERIYLFVNDSKATLNPSKNFLEYLLILFPFSSFSLS